MAMVLKTIGSNPLQVRVLHPPPSLAVASFGLMILLMAIARIQMMEMPQSIILTAKGVTTRLRNVPIKNSEIMTVPISVHRMRLKNSLNQKAARMMITII